MASRCETNRRSRAGGNPVTFNMLIAINNFRVDAGGSPAATHFSCFAKKSKQKKATRGSSPGKSAGYLPLLETTDCCGAWARIVIAINRLRIRHGLFFPGRATNGGGSPCKANAGQSSRARSDPETDRYPKAKQYFGVKLFR